MYGENTNTMAIPIYRVLPYPVIKPRLTLEVSSFKRALAGYAYPIGMLLCCLHDCTDKVCLYVDTFINCLGKK